MKKMLGLVVGLAVMAAVSCVTVNIYFPASAIQKAADEIVDDIHGTDQKQEEKKPDQKKDHSSLLFRLHIIGLGATEAYAEVDIKVSTPAIRAIRETLKSHFPELKPYFENGTIGNNDKGFVEIRNAQALSLKERADLNRMVQQHNSDRTALYREILRANGLGTDMMGEIQKLFANSWREKSHPGWWIKQDNGQWIKK